MTHKLIIGLISFFSIQNSPIYITFLKRRRQIMHKKENVQFIKNSLHHKQSSCRILLLFIVSVLDKKIFFMEFEEQRRGVYSKRTYWILYIYPLLRTSYNWLCLFKLFKRRIEILFILCLNILIILWIPCFIKFIFMYCV